MQRVSFGGSTERTRDSVWVSMLSAALYQLVSSITIRKGKGERKREKEREGGRREGGGRSVKFSSFLITLCITSSFSVHGVH